MKIIDDADKNNSTFRFYESIPDEIGMLIGEFPKKGSPSDKHILIYKKKFIS